MKKVKYQGRKNLKIKPGYGCDSANFQHLPGLREYGDNAVVPGHEYGKVRLGTSENRCRVCRAPLIDINRRRLKMRLLNDICDTHRRELRNCNVIYKR